MKQKYKILFFFIMILSGIYPNLIFTAPKINVSKSNFVFGVTERGQRIGDRFFITNNGNEPLNVDIIPSCDCLTANPLKLILNPKEQQNVNFSFDTSEYIGDVMNNLILNTNDPDQKRLFITIEVMVVDKGASNTAVIEETPDETDTSGDELAFYASGNCSECRKIMIRIRKWQEDQKITQIPFHLYDLNKSENKVKLSEIADKIGSFPELPLMIYQGKYYAGKKAILNYLENKSVNEIAVQSRDVGILLAITGGLTDGINPCAFTAIILLVSYMSLQLRKKSHILLTGICYILAVFITYFLIGLGLFQIIKGLRYFTVVSYILRYGLSLFLFVLAFLSLYDYFQSKKGKSNDMILKLPAYFQNSIRKNIRLQMKDYRIVLGAIVLGVSMSLFELACTGQIYFPILGYLSRDESRLRGLVLLVVYNICFVIPLIIVFILIYKGISSKTIGDFFSRRVSLVKFLFFLFFIAFGIFNLVLS